jgi:hypothetical protein
MVSETIWVRNVPAAWLLLVFVLLQACSAKPTSMPNLAATPTIAVDVVNVVEPTESPLTQPTPTSTPEPLPDLAILLIPPGLASSQYEGVQALLEEKLAETGVPLQVTSTLSEEDLGEHVRLVTAISPPEGISDLILSSPHTHFITLGAVGLPPQNNLNQIEIENPSADLAAFMAGVIGAIITPDWRIGVIAADEVSSRAFINGGVYFCGLCRQVYPPFFDAQGTYITLPLQYTLPADASESDWQLAGQYMIDRGVQNSLPARRS